jgi:hypothetical protein
MATLGEEPGDSYSNPIWYRDKWRLYVDPDTWPPFAVAYTHDDYDGAPDANDNRHGYARNFIEARTEIDELFYDGVPWVEPWPTWKRCLSCAFVIVFIVAFFGLLIAGLWHGRNDPAYKACVSPEGNTWVDCPRER